ATGGPVTLLFADPDDHFGPVAHGDVLPLPVHVEVTGYAVRRHREVAADAVRAEAEVAHRLELAQLDLGALGSQGEDPPRQVAKRSSSSPWSTTDWSRFSVPTTFAITVS